MRKIELHITPELMSAMGLTNASDDSAIATAIMNMSKKAQLAETLNSRVTELTAQNNTVTAQLNALQEASKKEQVATLLANAVKDGKLTNEGKAEYEAQFAGNPEGLQKVLNVLKPYISVTQQLNGAQQGGKATNKTELVNAWDKHFMEGTLENVIKDEPDVYAAMYEAKFGKAVPA